MRTHYKDETTFEGHVHVPGEAIKNFIVRALEDMGYVVERVSLEGDDAYRWAEVKVVARPLTAEELEEALSERDTRD